MSGLFPKFNRLPRSGSGGNNSHQPSDIEEDFGPPIQEQQHNSSSAPHITTYQTKIGDPGSTYNRNPIVTSGTFIFKNHQVPASQDIVPQMRNLQKEYSSEAKRLRTFFNWPANSVVDKKLLAQNGFIYLNVNDRVQCVFCRGVLSDWEQGDIVANEHKTHCPECPLAFGYDCGNIPLTDNIATLESRTVQAPVDALRNVPASPQQLRNPRPQNQAQYNTTVTVPLQQHSGHQSTINIMPNHPTAVNVNSDVIVRGEANSTSVQNILQKNNLSSVIHHNVSDAIRFNSDPVSLPQGHFSMPAAKSGPVLTNGPRYAAWADESVRVQSFKGWPAQMTQTPRSLAEAGLLYMGKL